MQLSIGIFLLFGLLVASAHALQSVCGFGFGILLMSFLPYLFPSTNSAVIVSSLLGLVASAALTFRYRRCLAWRKIAFLLLGYCIVGGLLVGQVTAVDERLLRRLLGAFLIALSLYFIAFSKKITLRATPWTGLAAGGISGVMSAFFSMGGPPISLYCLAAFETNEAYLANIQLFTLASSVYINVFRLLNGQCTRLELRFFLLGLPALLVGDWVGKRIFDRLNPDSMRRLIYALMTASGLVLLLAAR